jgi:hypothetical protein
MTMTISNFCSPFEELVWHFLKGTDDETVILSFLVKVEFFGKDHIHFLNIEQFGHF